MGLAKVNKKLAKLGKFLVNWGGTIFVFLMISSIYYTVVYTAGPLFYEEDESSATLLHLIGNIVVAEIIVNLVCFKYYSRYNSVTFWHRESCVADLRTYAEEHIDIPEADRHFGFDTLENHLNSPPFDETSSKFCVTCNREAPIRSHHCPLCKICVLRKDHHCFVTGACVGLGNQRYFIVFLFWCMVGLLVALPHLFWLLNHAIGYWYPLGFLMYIGPVAIGRWLLSYSTFSEAVYATIFSFAVAGLVSAGGFFGIQLYYTSEGYTMYEYHHLTVSASFKGDGETLGERFRLVFGRNWLLNFLFPMPWNPPILTPVISDSLFRVRSKVL